MARGFDFALFAALLTIFAESERVTAKPATPSQKDAKNYKPHLTDYPTANVLTDLG